MTARPWAWIVIGLSVALAGLAFAAEHRATGRQFARGARARQGARRAAEER